jgi:hypothetical protein
MTLPHGVALYPGALGEAGLPAEKPCRDAPRSHIEFGARVASCTHAPPPTTSYPLDHVPLWQWAGDDSATGSNRQGERGVDGLMAQSKAPSVFTGGGRRLRAITPRRLTLCRRGIKPCG